MPLHCLRLTCPFMQDISSLVESPLLVHSSGSAFPSAPFPYPCRSLQGPSCHVHSPALCRCTTGGRLPTSMSSHGPWLPPDPNPRPLERCTSTWQSALSHQEIVDSLLEEEIKEGWIAEVPGGVVALNTQYSSCAVGKLGLVQAPGDRRASW